ncbi:PAS domain-containing protein [Anaerobacillus sp. HL2]|nr:PAS domain-containing protein [Anaerobacillus sp. HL2]
MIRYKLCSRSFINRCSYGSKRIILSINDTFCQISKYSREELIGKNHRVLKSEHHTDEFFAQMWQTIKSSNVWRGEVKNRAKEDEQAITG